MGWQDITILFYGVPLTDEESDKTLGMLARYQRARLYPDGVVHGVPLSGEARDTLSYHSSRNVGGPLTEQAGRMWVGVWVERGDPLPEDRQDRVWPADAREVRGVVPLTPSPPANVVERWDHFAAWCRRRGVELPSAGLYVVADYD